jgi:hypothetical protein
VVDASIGTQRYGWAAGSSNQAVVIRLVRANAMTGSPVVRRSPYPAGASRKKPRLDLSAHRTVLVRIERPECALGGLDISRLRGAPCGQRNGAPGAVIGFCFRRDQQSTAEHSSASHALATPLFNPLAPIVVEPDCRAHRVTSTDGNLQSHQALPPPHHHLGA